MSTSSYFVNYIVHLDKNNCQMVKLRLLPYSFKFIGLVLFVIGGIPLFLMGAYEGLTGVPEGSIEYSFLNLRLESIMEIAGSMGILLYFLAKDKHYDELYQRLRDQVLTLVFTISVVIITLVHVISPSTSLDAYGLVTMQMCLFLLIRFLVKQAHKSPEMIEAK